MGTAEPAPDFRRKAGVGSQSAELWSLPEPVELNYRDLCHWREEKRACVACAVLAAMQLNSHTLLVLFYSVLLVCVSPT